ncbi:MAG TPA: ABC transporter substrate-binding protein [Alphaproteobacteria bacterium]|nr:ABC transporter substrate-binding protein [Alphaproteobacteria bacterium]HNS43915.1 ABC transporter substrate-binding protein [Alphaproteobacteria bacterium]
MKKLLILFALISFAIPALAQDAKESTYKRVIRTKTIRCGYVVLPPHIIKDQNTGQMSGIIYDVMESAAKILDLRIDWSEEVGFANMDPGLQNGRYDAICFGYWQNPYQAKLGYIGFSTPLYYMPVGAFVRADDTRFDKDIMAINDPSIRISSSDGMIAGMIAAQDFPKAQVVSLPNLTDITDNLMNVATGKADVTFLAFRDGFRFEEMNPGEIKNAAATQPVRVFASTIAFPQADHQFEIMLNTAFMQLINGGMMDRILKKYEEYPGAVLPVAKPYEIQK